MKPNLDVTENLKGIPSATQIAEEIRQKIREETWTCPGKVESIS